MKIYYIERLRNGFTFRRLPICEYVEGKDYVEELIFDKDGEEVDYYQDIAGNYDEVDLFLSKGTNKSCNEYDLEDHLGTKSNVYLEYWYTDVLGYYDDRYIGLEIV